MRWKIEYQSDSLDNYARQLDHIGIYLGAVNGDTNEILIVDQLGVNPRARLSDRKTQSSVLRFEHQRQAMRRWDRTLCVRAGVDLDGCFVVQFFPEQTRKLLGEVEWRHLNAINRSIREVRRTVFRVAPTPEGFEFRVAEMQFRD